MGVPLVFMGSPAVAVPSLRALIAFPGVEVTGVFAQPDRPVGRRRRLQPCPVREAAEALGLPVHTPERAGAPEALAVLREWSPRLIVVCAYGHLLPETILSLPPLGCFNLHFSLLPRWRGASPVQAALLAGDAATGVTLQRMVKALDAGPSAAETAPLPIAPEDTAGTLSERLAAAAAHLIAEALPALLRGNPPLREQDPAGVTWCRTLRKEQGNLRWGEETAAEIERKVRAFDPWPGCFTYLGSRRLAVTRVEVTQTAFAGPPGVLLPGGVVPTRAGAVRLLEVKPAGKQAMSLEAFLRGAPQPPGSVLTTEPAA